MISCNCIRLVIAGLKISTSFTTMSPIQTFLQGVISQMENDKRLARVAGPAVVSSLMSVECWLQASQSSPHYRHPLHHIMRDRLSSGVWSLVCGVIILPVLLCIVMLALFWLRLLATFLSRLAMRSFSSLLLQVRGLTQRTLTAACSTSEVSLSLLLWSSDSDSESSDDMYSEVISGKYFALSSSEMAVDCFSTLDRFNRFCTGDNKKFA